MADPIVSIQRLPATGNKCSAMATLLLQRASSAAIKVAGCHAPVRGKLMEPLEQARLPCAVHGVFDRMASGYREIGVDADAPAASCALIQL
jgi:hypothetical protein